MKVRDLMMPDPVMCTPETPLSQVVQLLGQGVVQDLPVVDSMENRALVGMITHNDLEAHRNDPALDGDAPGGEVMTKDIPFCSPDDEVEDIEDAMDHCHVHSVPVVDGAGRCIGVVARADLRIGGSGVGLM